MPSELPKIEKPVVEGVLKQDPEQRKVESAALAEVETAKRTLFYRQCVEGNLDLDQRKRDIIARAISTRKTAAWASYDGSDVKLESITVEGDVIVIKFDFFDGMNIATEKISM